MFDPPAIHWRQADKSGAVGALKRPAKEVAPKASACLVAHYMHCARIDSSCMSLCLLQAGPTSPFGTAKKARREMSAEIVGQKQAWQCLKILKSVADVVGHMDCHHFSGHSAKCAKPCES